MSNTDEFAAIVSRLDMAEEIERLEQLEKLYLQERASMASIKASLDKAINAISEAEEYYRNKGERNEQA